MHTAVVVDRPALAYGVLLADGRPVIFPPCRPVVHGVMGVTSTGNLWNRETGNPATARAGYFEEEEL